MLHNSYVENYESRNKVRYRYGLASIEKWSRLSLLMAERELHPQESLFQAQLWITQLLQDASCMGDSLSIHQMSFCKTIPISPSTHHNIRMLQRAIQLPYCDWRGWSGSSHPC